MMISKQSTNAGCLQPLWTSQTSKRSLLWWIGSIVKTLPDNFEIEELGEGSVYCQILNSYSPGVIPDTKINYKPKN